MTAKPHHLRLMPTAPGAVFWKKEKAASRSSAVEPDLDPQGGAVSICQKREKSPCSAIATARHAANGDHAAGTIPCRPVDPPLSSRDEQHGDGCDGKTCKRKQLRIDILGLLSMTGRRAARGRSAAPSPRTRPRPRSCSLRSIGSSTAGIYQPLPGCPPQCRNAVRLRCGPPEMSEGGCRAARGMAAVSPRCPILAPRRDGRRRQHG